MEITDYLRALRQRWLLLLIVVVVTAGLAAAGSFLTPATYESSSRIVVTAVPRETPTDAYQGQLLAEKMVATYAEMLTSELMATVALDAAESEIAPEEWTDAVRVEVTDETSVLTIRARADSAAQAREIAQLAAESLVGYVAADESDNELTAPVLKVEILDPALEPASPVSPQPIRNIILGVVLGLVIGGAIAVLRYRRPGDTNGERSMEDDAPASPAALDATGSALPVAQGTAQGARRRPGARRRND